MILDSECRESLFTSFRSHCEWSTSDYIVLCSSCILLVQIRPVVLQQKPDVVLDVEPRRLASENSAPMARKGNPRWRSDRLTRNARGCAAKGSNTDFSGLGMQSFVVLENLEFLKWMPGDCGREARGHDVGMACMRRGDARK